MNTLPNTHKIYILWSHSPLKYENKIPNLLGIYSTPELAKAQAVDGNFVEPYTVISD